MILFLITFAVFIFFIIIWKQGLLLSAIVALVVVLAYIIFSKGAQPNEFLASILYALLVTAEISLLIFGALLFYNYLKAVGFIGQLENSLHQFSNNKLVIVIVLAFFFGSFMEGVSGFGTPAMIIAPLLLGLKYPAYLAAALPLLATTVSVLFGAVGTPVKIGLAGLTDEQTPFLATILVALPAVLIPIYCKKFLEADSLIIDSKGNGKMYLMAVLAGISFMIPFIAFSFTGPDFPSVAASLTGLVLWLFLVNKMKFSFVTVSRSTLMQLFKTFKPYLFIALLLVVFKLLLGDSKFVVEWPNVGVSKSISYFQPGIVFLIGLLILMLLDRNKTANSFYDVFKQTAARLPRTIATIVCLTIIARLFSEYLDVKELLSNQIFSTSLYYVLAVFTGFIGSFIAGSATVSNLMFGTEWYVAGQQLHLNISLLMAAQLAGSAMGNALSIQNIAMVQAVINKKDLESAVISKLWKPILLFILLIMIAAILLGLWLDN